MMKVIRMITKTLRTYEELCTFSSFEERLEYLMLYGSVGQETFGQYRYVNQKFYKSSLWLEVRNKVIIRDNGCDLGIEDRTIYDYIMIHHMNPLLLTDIIHQTDILLNMNYLISSSPATHKAIHYQNKAITNIPKIVERRKFDTIPWRKGGLYE